MRNKLVAKTMIAGAFLGLFLILSCALAQEFGGIFVSEFEGEQVVLELQQNADGYVLGTLTLGGDTLQLDGSLPSENEVVGVTLQQGQVFSAFSITMQSDGLAFSLGEMSQGGEADFSGAPVLLFSPLEGVTAPDGAVNPLAPTASNPLSPQTQPNAEDPFVGTFSDGNLSLVLEGGQGRYSGHIEFGEQRYPTAAQASGNVLSGQFQANGGTFTFSATLEGTNLSFITSETTYALSKQPDTSASNTQPATPSTSSVATPTTPATPSTTHETGSAEIQAYQQYSGGTRVRSSALGISYLIPDGWIGIVADQMSFAMSSSDRQGLLLVRAQVGASQDDILSYLGTAQDLGNGVVIQPLGQAQIIGRELHQRYQVGTFSGQAVSVYGDHDNAVIFFAVGPVSDDAYYARLLGNLADSVQFSQAEALETLQQWNVNLAGKKLYLFDYQAPSIAFAPGQGADYTREATWHLCSDGRYASKDTAGGTINLSPQSGGASNASFNSASFDQAQAAGSWNVIMVGALPILSLRSNAGTWQGLPLGFDGTSVFLGGQAVTVNQSELCR